MWVVWWSLVALGVETVEVDARDAAGPPPSSCKADLGQIDVEKADQGARTAIPRRPKPAADAITMALKRKQDIKLVEKGDMTS